MRLILIVTLVVLLAGCNKKHAPAGGEGKKETSESKSAPAEGKKETGEAKSTPAEGKKETGEAKSAPAEGKKETGEAKSAPAPAEPAKASRGPMSGPASLEALKAVSQTPAPAEAPKGAKDPATEAWYAPVTAELAAMNRNAEGLVQRKKSDEAAAAITRAQPLATRLLTAPRPTLAAMEAVSDLCQINARMLMSNGNAGWARLEFQKNVSRWKNWRPQTADTARRLKVAEDGIAECDRLIGK